MVLWASKVKKDGVIEIPYEILYKAGFTDYDIENAEVIIKGDRIWIKKPKIKE
ncbi:MAG: hypothetical protein ACE5J3_08680 [Methanosarcinales archaeon]